MPVCASCDNEKFELVDGFYYCTLCQTQSQDMREMEVPSWTGQLTREIRPRKTDKDVQKKITRDFGRAWRTYEAWTLILKQQIEALIEKCGATPEVKTLCEQLWLNYLGKTGDVGSKEQREEAAKNPYIIKRQRDQYPPTMKCPVVMTMRKMRTLLKRGNPVGKETAKRIEEENEMAEGMASDEEDDLDDDLDDSKEMYIAMMRMMMENHHDYDGEERPWMKVEADSDEVVDGASNVDEDDEDDMDVEDDGDDDDDLLYAELKREKGKKTSPLARDSYMRHPANMSMPKTIAFVYLVAHYHHPITPNDLIKWVDQGDIPYFDAVNKLPEEMKFSASDFKTFYGNVNPLREDQIRGNAGRIAEFIGLKVHCPNIKIMALDFILHLKLPVDLNTILVNDLLRRKTPNVVRDKQQATIPNYAAFAMAYVVLLLKKLFMLNGVVDRKLSEFAEEVNETLKVPHLVFSISEWISAHEADGHTTQWSKADRHTQQVVKQPENLPEYLAKNFPERQSTMARRRSYASNVNYFHYKTEKKVRESEVSFLRDLQSTIRHKKQCVEEAPEPSSLEPAAVSHKATLDKLQMGTLQYITEGPVFMDRLDHLGLTEETVRWAYEESSDEEEEDDDDDDQSNSNDSNSDSDSTKRKLKIKEKRTRKRRRMLLRKELAGKKKNVEHVHLLDKERMGEKLRKILAEKKFWYQELSDKKHHLYPSYLSALNICAHHIGVYGWELHWFVQRLELVLFKAKTRNFYRTRFEWIYFASSHETEQNN